MASRSPRGPGRKPHTGRPSGQRGGRPAPRARTTAPKKTSAGTGPQLTTRAVVLVSVVLLLVASYTSVLHAWWDGRQDIQTSRAEVVMKKQQIRELNDQIDRWDDPAYVKQQAKERFGWVSPGEVGYRVIGSDGKIQGADVPQLDSPAEAAAPQWYDKLWGSVQQAGRQPAAKKTSEPDPDKVLKNQ